MADFYELPTIQFCSYILVVLNFILKNLLVCLVIGLDYESLAPSMAKTINGLNLVSHY